MQRREFMAMGAVALAGSVYGAGESVSSKPINTEALVIQPLAFDPKTLDGFSERIIVSHYENNYTGAVKRAKAIQEKIAAQSDAAMPFELGALKREEMVALNSMILHEYYFDNLGAKGSSSPSLDTELSKAFGSYVLWEIEFKKMALSLGGGSGWILLVYNHRLKRLENVWAWDHMHALWDSQILLALDMYEHSYQMDFGANAKGYIDQFFKNINWDKVNERHLSL